MEQFREYSPEDIILANLEENSTRRAYLLEQELAHVTELAREMIESQSDEDALLAALPDFSLSASQNEESATDALLRRLSQSHFANSNLLLCSALCRRLGNERLIGRLQHFVDTDLSKVIGNGRIAYQKNTFTDTAFLRFSSLLDSPRATYTHSFLSACEEVRNGNCQYCILPIENATEGRLVSFAKLINRFALKIIATCEITENEGKSTRFALLSASYEMLSASGAECFLEISIPLDHPNPSHLLQAAEICGLPLCRLTSVPSSDPEETYHLQIVFSASAKAETELPSFLLYLHMDAPQHTLIGIYPHLKP